MTTRYTQPQAGPLEIDWGNPLARGLVFAAIPLGHGWIDVISGQLTYNVGTVRGRRTIDGDQAYAISGIGAGSGSGGRFPAQTGLDRIAGPGTIFVEASLEVDASNQTLCISREPVTTGDAFGIKFDDISVITNGVNLYQNNAVPASSAADSLGLNSELYTHRVALTVDGSNAKFYTQGVLNSTVALTSLPNANSGRFTTLVGQDNTQSSGSLAIALAWSRAISLTEYQQLFANPWQIFKAPRRVLVSASAPAIPPLIGIQTDLPQRSKLQLSTSFQVSPVAADNNRETIGYTFDLPTRRKKQSSPDFQLSPLVPDNQLSSTVSILDLPVLGRLPFQQAWKQSPLRPDFVQMGGMTFENPQVRRFLKNDLAGWWQGPLASDSPLASTTIATDLPRLARGAGREYNGWQRSPLAPSAVPDFTQQGIFCYDLPVRGRQQPSLYSGQTASPLSSNGVISQTHSFLPLIGVGI